MAKSFPNTGATVIDTSADLPAASAALEGVMMFQKDTNELKICDGASWISMLDTDTPPIFSSRIKTGRATIPANGGQTTVTFASAFPNTNFTLITNGTRGSSDNPAMVWTSDITTSSFIVYARNPAAAILTVSCVIHWIAIAD